MFRWPRKITTDPPRIALLWFLRCHPLFKLTFKSQNRQEFKGIIIMATIEESEAVKNRSALPLSAFSASSVACNVTRAGLRQREAS